MSDHETRHRETVPFAVATCNIGPAGITAARNAMRRAAVVGFEECSDQDRVFVQLREDGYGVVRFDRHVGQAATAIVYDKDELILIRAECIPLFHGGPIGPGTGPDRGKPKWLTVAYFVHKKTRRRVAVAVIHGYAGQKQAHGGNLRQDVTERMVTEARDHLSRYTGVAILLGDFNAEPDTPTVAPLRSRGWKCNHLVQHELPTHGLHWTPDHVWWNDDRGRIWMVSHAAIKVGSDHRLLVVVFVLSVRKVVGR